jgi:hypothetical protein
MSQEVGEPAKVRWPRVRFVRKSGRSDFGDVRAVDDPERPFGLNVQNCIVARLGSLGQ